MRGGGGALHNRGEIPPRMLVTQEACIKEQGGKGTGRKKT